MYCLMQLWPTMIQTMMEQLIFNEKWGIILSY